MTDKEIEKEIRRWLDYTVRKGVYNTGVMLALKNLYYRGQQDVQDKIKEALQIKECDHDF